MPLESSRASREFRGTREKISASIETHPSSSSTSTYRWTTKYAGTKTGSRCKRCFLHPSNAVTDRYPSRESRLAEFHSSIESSYTSQSRGLHHCPARDAQWTSLTIKSTLRRCSPRGVVYSSSLVTLFKPLMISSRRLGPSASQNSLNEIRWSPSLSE